VKRATPHRSWHLLGLLARAAPDSETRRRFGRVRDQSLARPGWTALGSRRDHSGLRLGGETIRKVLLAVACCGEAAAAGCSSSSDGSSSGSATKASSNCARAVDQAQRNVDTYYANTSVGPPTTGPAAVKRATVAVLVGGLSLPTGAEGAAAAHEAGKHLDSK
jgi:hypothetical protein